jgi:peptidoglycan/xylan/chitin deacetylase (PgdA/CDA1 family)
VSAVIKKATGESPTLLRPPYGQVNSAVKSEAKARGMSIILWNVDPRDWEAKDTDVVAKRLVKAAKKGAILLSHDVWPTTRAAYAEVIDKLQAKGYVFVTVPELIGKPKPGKVYTSG